MWNLMNSEGKIDAIQKFFAHELSKLLISGVLNEIQFWGADLTNTQIFGNSY